QLLLYVRGEGGTGKSVAIKAVESFVTQVRGKNTVKLCGPTGIAADNIGGHTIHSLLNI
ncbi:hypothetical protein K440DRAFT_511239, partial [Wilcoxina mikolae CBS 423.85]